MLGFILGIIAYILAAYTKYGFISIIIFVPGIIISGRAFKKKKNIFAFVGLILNIFALVFFILWVMDTSFTDIYCNFMLKITTPQICIHQI